MNCLHLNGYRQPCWPYAGGIIMTFAALLFFIVFFGTMFSKKTSAGRLDLPVSEALHDEKRIPLFDTFQTLADHHGYYYTARLYSCFHECQ